MQGADAAQPAAGTVQVTNQVEQAPKWWCLDPQKQPAGPYSHAGIAGGAHMLSMPADLQLV